MFDSDVDSGLKTTIFAFFLMVYNHYDDAI